MILSFGNQYPTILSAHQYINQGQVIFPLLHTAQTEMLVSLLLHYCCTNLNNSTCTTTKACLCLQTAVFFSNIICRHISTHTLIKCCFPTQLQPAQLRHACPPHPHHPDRGGRVFSFDFRRQRAGRGAIGGPSCEQYGRHPPPLPSRQLNYVQVDLEAGGSSCPGHGVGGAQVPQRPPPLKRGMAAAAAAPPSRRGECYAVIDLQKTAAMSNLQKALPRDDGTSRKTRHNSTDLPL